MYKGESRRKMEWNVRKRMVIFKSKLLTEVLDNGMEIPNSWYSNNWIKLNDIIILVIKDDYCTNI